MTTTKVKSRRYRCIFALDSLSKFFTCVERWGEGEERLITMLVVEMKEDAVAAYWLGRTMVHLPHASLFCGKTPGRPMNT